MGVNNSSKTVSEKLEDLDILNEAAANLSETKVDRITNVKAYPDEKEVNVINPEGFEFAALNSPGVGSGASLQLEDADNFYQISTSTNEGTREISIDEIAGGVNFTAVEKDGDTQSTSIILTPKNPHIQGENESVEAQYNSERNIQEDIIETLKQNKSSDNSVSVDVLFNSDAMSKYSKSDIERAVWLMSDDSLDLQMGTHTEHKIKNKFGWVILRQTENDKIIQTPGDRIKESSNSLKQESAISSQHVKVESGLLMPVSSTVYPASWSDAKVKNEEKKRKEYIEAGLIPFFNRIDSGVKGRVSNEIFDLSELRNNMDRVEVAVEKTNLLSKNERNLKYGSFGGQNIQTKTSKGVFQGLYFQKGKKGEVPFFFKADILKVDADDTGHYLAYMNQMYSGYKPKKIFFGGVEGEIDMTRVNRFLSKQIISSLSYQRNRAVADAIKESFESSNILSEYEDRGIKSSPLVYRTANGDTVDLSVSEEQLAIADRIEDSPVRIHVKMVEGKEISFDYNNEDLDETQKPTIRFEPSKFGNVSPLDSDTLIRVAVDRLGLEPDTVQSKLEALYHQGWINYPRTDTIKASDEPVFLIRDLTSFKGVENERKLLELIDAADKAYKAGKPFTLQGNWILKQGDAEIIERGAITSDEQKFYNHYEFDISLKSGVTPVELTEYLIDYEIATPATRTSTLASLREAGIIELARDRTYTLDTRGLILAAAYSYLQNDSSMSGLDIKRKLTRAENIEEMFELVNSFKVIDRKSMSAHIQKEGGKLINKRNDLTVLDSY